MEHNKSFDQAEYWRKRHEEYAGDPRSVGCLSYGIEDNLVGERELLATMTDIAKFIAPKTVLDLGCGYGRLAPAFVMAGAEYTGVDVSYAPGGDRLAESVRYRSPRQA